MNTLNLNRQSRGYYHKRVGSIEVTVSNSFVVTGLGSDLWEATICDISREDDCILFRDFASTKREAYKAIVDAMIRQNI